MHPSPDDYLADKQRFARALELRGTAREQYLDQVRAEDEEGGIRLERLLAAEATAEGFLAILSERSAGFATPTPETIGPYRILEVLGVGGMGIVYRAIQLRPRREVALKVLRSGLVEESTSRRFEREAEVLGRLSHPGIAQVYEAGTWQVAGMVQPYFAMELVEGDSLLDFAQRHRLPQARRIELLAEVCDAVEHAHQRSILHRDLKPSNILVSSEGQVKVLDFGIALVLEDEAGVSALRTASGMLVGTLAYMSPEQARGSRELESRSDVYSLGVLAYEMLSGRLPHDFAHLSFHAALATIVEGEPQRLGTLAPELRGDLESIVGRALEKEPKRRYRSAAALADDLRRTLRNEPIEARPPSTLYQLRKFTLRNRILVSGIVSTIGALVAGLAVSLNQYRLAEAARHLAQREAELALREADKAKSINEFLLQDLLAAPDPWDEDGDIRVATVLDRSALRVQQRFSTEPALEADVRATLGRSYMARGEYDKAKIQLERALLVRRALHAGDHPDLAHSLESLGTLQGYRGEYREGERLAREAVAMSDRLHQEAHDATGDALQALSRSLVSQGKYDEARPYLLRCLALRKELHATPHSEWLSVLGDLGALEHYAQDFAQAAQYQARALEMATEIHGPTSPFVGVAENDLAQTEMMVLPRARRGEAIERMRRGFSILTNALGPEHAVTLRTRRNLGVALGQGGQLEEAEAMLFDAYDLSRQILGREHLDTIQSGNAVAHFLMGQNRDEEALGILDEVLPLGIEVLGSDHPDVMVAMLNRAWLVRRGGSLEESLELFRDAHAGFVAAHGPTAWRTLVAQRDILTLLIELERLEEAGQVLLDFDQLSTTLGEPLQRSVAIDMAQAANRLGAAAMTNQQHADAARFLAVGHGLCTILWSPEDWRTADTASKLGACLALNGESARAEELLRQSYEALRENAARGDVMAEAQRRLAEYYEAQGEPKRAAEVRDGVTKKD